MASTWVLKFPQVDLPKQPFLVRVTQKNGLDLDLLATDGEVAYRGKVRERSLAKLKASNYGGSDDEWKSILHHTFLSKPDSNISQAQEESLEVQCAVSGKGSKAILSIAFRTKIENITSRLGSIELANSDDTDDVDLFGWTVTVIDERDHLRTTATGSKLSQDAMQAKIASLQEELKDLIDAKEEYEKQMLSKFTILLNNKKEKIRNQQRILSSAKVDPLKLEELQLTMDGIQSHESNGRKRKGKPAKAQPDDEESDGFEAMEVDTKPTMKETLVESDDDSQGEATSSESDDERGSSNATRGLVKGNPHPTAEEDRDALPPPRNLPFQKKGDKVRASVVSTLEDKSIAKGGTAADEDDETASENDEL